MPNDPVLRSRVSTFLVCLSARGPFSGTTAIYDPCHLRTISGRPRHQLPRDRQLPMVPDLHNLVAYAWWYGSGCCPRYPGVRCVPRNHYRRPRPTELAHPDIDWRLQLFHFSRRTLGRGARLAGVRTPSTGRAPRSGWRNATTRPPLDWVASPAVYSARLGEFTAVDLPADHDRTVSHHDLRGKSNAFQLDHRSNVTRSL